MTFISPLARQLERFVCGRICALSRYVPADLGSGSARDSLASPVHASKAHASNAPR